MTAEPTTCTELTTANTQHKLYSKLGVLIMDALTRKPAVWNEWKESKRLRALAVCEDSETCARVVEFLRDLSGDLGRECQIIKRVWLVNEFFVPELKEIAANEAAHDDLIILSTHSDGNLPEQVQSWVDLWLLRKGGRPAVLGALLDPNPEQDSALMQVRLQEIAKRGNLEFFAQ